jgi:small subunit ribosomal protein S2
MAVVTLSEMMEAGAHFGHQTRRWNPKMSRYIYCARNGVHIIDLVKTAVCMNNAYKWTRSAARSGKRFLFVGTKKQASEVVALEAARCGAAYVNQRWLGGMLTNWTTMKARIDRLKDLERMESSGAIAMRPKKEGAVLRRELERLQKYLGGLKTMRRLPDVVVPGRPTPGIQCGSRSSQTRHPLGVDVGYQLRSRSLRGSDSLQR